MALPPTSQATRAENYRFKLLRTAGLAPRPPVSPILVGYQILLFARLLSLNYRYPCLQPRFKNMVSFAVPSPYRHAGYSKHIPSRASLYALRFQAAASAKIKTRYQPEIELCSAESLQYTERKAVDLSSAVCFLIPWFFIGGL